MVTQEPRLSMHGWAILALAWLLAGLPSIALGEWTGSPLLQAWAAAHVIVAMGMALPLVIIATIEAQWLEAMIGGRR